MAHTLVHDEDAHRTTRTRVFEMGWPAFWLLGGILAGLVGLAALILGLARGF